MELGNKGIPLDNFQSYLPYCIPGFYMESYYNNISLCPRYADIRIVLLNAGGYSMIECFNSFPLKFRASGPQSLIQWYNGWKYKINIMLSNLPFMNAVHPGFKDEISSLVATLGVVAGLTQEQREAVINRPCLSNAHFIQECNSWYLASHQAVKNIPSYHPYSSNHSDYHHHSRSGFNHGSSHQPQTTSNYHPNSPLSPSHHNIPRRDLSSVVCFKCNCLVHYANECMSRPPSLIISNHLTTTLILLLQFLTGNPINLTNLINRNNLIIIIPVPVIIPNLLLFPEPFPNPSARWIPLILQLPLNLIMLASP